MPNLEASRLLGQGQSVLGGVYPSGQSDTSTSSLTEFEKAELQRRERQAASSRKRMKFLAESQRSTMERRQNREREKQKSRIAADYRTAQQQKRDKQVHEEQEKARLQQLEQDELDEAAQAFSFEAESFPSIIDSDSVILRLRNIRPAR